MRERAQFGCLFTQAGGAIFVQLIVDLIGTVGVDLHPVGFELILCKNFLTKHSEGRKSEAVGRKCD